MPETGRGDEAPVFQREGNFVRFNQRGAKILFPDDASNESYYAWLDGMVASIGGVVPGAEIVEKPAEREQPRRNSGVYYDTDVYDLLHGHMVLRTTSNPKTHAFCAFKLGEDEDGVRRDHRYVFEGEDKRTIQYGPTSLEAVAVVRRLLASDDMVQPGTVMREMTSISGESLSPALSVIQDRRTFYVWLDGQDSLRCSLDRASVRALRPEIRVRTGSFSEVELAIFPRISAEMMKDRRTGELISCIAQSLAEHFQVRSIADSKYRRAAYLLGLIGNFQ